jgi:hypothetical protein
MILLPREEHELDSLEAKSDWKSIHPAYAEKPLMLFPRRLRQEPSIDLPRYQVEGAFTRHQCSFHLSQHHTTDIFTPAWPRCSDGEQQIEPSRPHPLYISCRTRSEPLRIWQSAFQSLIHRCYRPERDQESKTVSVEDVGSYLRIQV